MQIFNDGRLALFVLIRATAPCTNRKHKQGGMAGGNENEEQKVSKFISGQMKPGSFNESLKQAFLSAARHEEIRKADLPERAENYLKHYYRQEYIKGHPDFIKIYNPGRVQIEASTADKGMAAGANMLCNYGDFESATPGNLGAQGYTGYAGPAYNYYSGGLCSFVPFTNVAYANVGFGNPDNFIVTDNIPDPNIPAIRQTHNGSRHAIRINGDRRCDQFGINMLQKSFSSAVSGKARINFSYALVLQGAHTGSDANGNAFFVARILDNNGVEVGSRICVPGHASGAGFQSTDLPDCRHTPDYKAHGMERLGLRFYRL